MKYLLTVLVAVAVLLPAAPAGADWFPGDGHKMHYPQLPDPDGWDVRISNARRDPTEPLQWVVADDWRCTATGPVKDIHFWVSWMQEVEDEIVNLHLSIHDDVPVGPDGWSVPGDLLWEWDLAPWEYTIQHYGTGDQGWYDPPFDDWWRPDHTNYYQINVADIPDPFIQEEGNIYWLDVSVDLAGESETGKLGWKTSLDHFNDNAVYWDLIGERWIELLDPETGAELDMAFVITPEPSSFVLAAMALTGLFILAWRRRRRKA